MRVLRRCTCISTYMYPSLHEAKKREREKKKRPIVRPIRCPSTRVSALNALSRSSSLVSPLRGRWRTELYICEALDIVPPMRRVRDSSATIQCIHTCKACARPQMHWRFTIPLVDALSPRCAIEQGWWIQKFFSPAGGARRLLSVIIYAGRTPCVR